MATDDVTAAELAEWDGWERAFLGERPQHAGGRLVLGTVAGAERTTYTPAWLRAFARWLYATGRCDRDRRGALLELADECEAAARKAVPA